MARELSKKEDTWRLLVHRVADPCQENGI